jgi:hypothetical protein
MKEIKLSQNGKKYGLYVALVDDEDYEYLNQWKWFVYPEGKTFYAMRNIYINNKCKQLRMHRIILNVSIGEIIDHKDHNGLNNQRNNIRVCTFTENTINTIKAKSKSQYWGVRIKKNNKYLSRIKSNYKVFNLGTYETEKEAALAYNRAAKIHHGEFAKQNIV